MLQGSELCHRMQELLGNYLLLERYFMKAVAMDALEEGSQTSSMVDDVYFIVRICICRASTSSSLDRVCAVINNAFALLETDFREVLRQQLRQGYLSGYLAYSVLHTSIQQGRLDSEQARLMF
ncbi:conserved oligomeric Golgi complex subunit 4-like isoform X3 [Periplaneta americana]|uniref:conserved oligomeric Golgi complex subunit 4-like isoform X3 n=1 Tax=Periplaneta americana TaxID=6978 RepID=UPI0037E73606